MRRTAINRRSASGPRTPHIQFQAKTPAGRFKCLRCGNRASTWHHWLAQRRLREHVRSLRLAMPEARATLNGLIHDERNMSPYCLICHIPAETSATNPFRRSEIPPSACQFADELGLLDQLLRDYPAR